MHHDAGGQCILLAALMIISLLAALMMIHMIGPDIEAVDEVKLLILEAVNAWKNCKKRVPSTQSRGPCVQKRPRDEECLLSTLGT
jgi:hypothetical protein